MTDNVERRTVAAILDDLADGGTMPILNEQDRAVLEREIAGEPSRARLFVALELQDNDAHRAELRRRAMALAEPATRDMLGDRFDAAWARASADAISLERTAEATRVATQTAYEANLARAARGSSTCSALGPSNPSTIVQLSFLALAAFMLLTRRRLWRSR